MRPAQIHPSISAIGPLHHESLSGVSGVAGVQCQPLFGIAVIQPFHVELEVRVRQVRVERRLNAEDELIGRLEGMLYDNVEALVHPGKLKVANDG